MPARHDLLVGALDFPWRPWGSIEMWEDAITTLLRQQAGISTMLASDHPHLFETGGENYHVDFGAWDYLRGHEDDPWRTRPDPSWIGAPALPVRRAPWERGYDISRTWFKEEADFPGPKTMAAAAAWLDGELSAERAPRRAGAARRRRVRPARALRHARAVGEPLRPDWDGERLIWPPYARSQEQSGLTERESIHLRSQYGAKLSMIDHWLGRILDVVDRHDAWDTTAFVLCTDHGHYLGERGLWGKPQVAVHPELGHIPLLVSWPGVAPTTNGALTTTVDLHATLCDVFGVTPEHRTHGQSLVPVLEGTATSVREWALCGVWGREVHVADATRTFAKAPVEENRPLSMFSNRWSTMPIRALPGYRMPRPDDRAWLDRSPGSDVPVIRQPFDPSDDIPFWGMGGFDGDVLYDREEAAGGEFRNQAGGGADKEMTDLLVEALRSIEAPDEQLVRWAQLSRCRSGRRFAPSAPAGASRRRGEASRLRRCDRAAARHVSMEVLKLESTDGFIAFDLGDAPAVGIVRQAPKVLRDGAELLARSTTYAAASFGLPIGGGSAGLNAKPDDRDAALAAFLEEVAPLVESGRWLPGPGVGIQCRRPVGPPARRGPSGRVRPDLRRRERRGGRPRCARLARRQDASRIVGGGPITEAAAASVAANGGTAAAPGRLRRRVRRAPRRREGRRARARPRRDRPGQGGRAAHPVPVTARALAVLGRAGVVVVPDFLSTAAPLLAAVDPDGGDAMTRVHESVAALAGEGTNLWMAAVDRAEAHLRTWQDELPFGRPLS